MKAQTQELINRTTQIQNEKYDILVLFDVFPGNSSIIFSQELNVKSCITEGFIDRFQLKPDELNALRSTRDGFLHPVRKKLFVSNFKDRSLSSLLAILQCTQTSQIDTSRL